MHDFKVGDIIHGFASGAFGRDSYDCRRVEAVGSDWVVTRNSRGLAEFTTSLSYIVDPEDRTHCSDMYDYDGYCPYEKS